MNIENCKSSKYTYAFLIIITGIFFSACEDDFLVRQPLDQVSNESFWNSAEDMKIYVNQFYTDFPGFPAWDGGIFWDDYKSDNMLPTSYDQRLAGLNTITTGNGSWSSYYGKIRDVNFFLDNWDIKVDGEASSSIKVFVGEAYFFRAYYYFELLKRYGGVPWIEKPLNTDSEELFKARTPRNEIVDHMLEDLDYAVENLQLKGSSEANRLNKETALAFKSRIALYEGTWEKYHQGTEFGVTNSNVQKYLEEAADAAKQLIDLGTAEIYSTGDPYHDYWNLFNKVDYSDNSEVLLWKKYDVSLGLYHNLDRYIPKLGQKGGLSKALVDDYLMDSGIPISASSRYQGDGTLSDVVENRDPRLHQTVWIPGDTTKIKNGEVTVFERPLLWETGSAKNTTGYTLKKGGSTRWEGQDQLYRGITGAIFFRYGEVLLNYAEAKAELEDLGIGTITQNDLDISVNKTRARVNMPPIVKGNITTDPNWEFPNLSPLLNEIRRERRVELAAEGYRLDDLMRWRAHHLVVNVNPKGAIFVPELFPEITVGEDLYISNDGYIQPYQNVLPGGWGFNPQRDYLLAVPPVEITLNEQLTQNPGW